MCSIHFIKGNEDVFLWGTKFDNYIATIDKEYRIIPANKNYYWYTKEEILPIINKEIGRNGRKNFKVKAYLTDISNQQYIANYIFIARVNNGIITFDTQQMGIKKEKWN